MFKEVNNLQIFFDNPEREFHLRELARILKKNPITVKRHLAPFVHEKVIICRAERNLELYSSNSENQRYKEYKVAYNRLKLFESGIINELKEKFNMPTIVLFGSYAKGEDNTNSDIDLGILSEIKEDMKLTKYENKLKRRIQLHTFSKKEWHKLKEANPALVNSIINGFTLQGFIEVL